MNYINSSFFCYIAVYGDMLAIFRTHFKGVKSSYASINCGRTALKSRSI